jgi:IclR family acetate operon transcriptional repressor
MATLPPDTIEAPTNEAAMMVGPITVEAWLEGPMKLSPASLSAVPVVGGVAGYMLPTATTPRDWLAAPSRLSRGPSISTWRFVSGQALGSGERPLAAFIAFMVDPAIGKDCVITFRMMGSPPSGSPVQSVSRAFALLEAVSERGDARLVEVARHVGLHPSTAHRLLASLIDCGYVMQSPVTGHYRLGRKVLELVNRSNARDARLRSVARPHLEAIRAAVDESANLVALDGFAAMYLEQVESRRAVRLFAEPGRRVPAHCSGAGKAMLAFQDDGMLDRLYAGEPFEALTANTITGAVALREELAQVRVREFAIDDEEHEEGVSCVGAAIFDDVDAASAAISVSAPSTRLHRCGVDQLGALLARHAREISRELRQADGTG